MSNTDERAGAGRGGGDARFTGRSAGAPSDERVDDRAVYIISVAAELAGVHPQTLRIYERKGLLAPKRTAGNTRRYSERDIARLRMIQDLTQQAGVNLAGVKLIMQMQNRVEELQRRAEELEREVLRARERAAADSGEIVPAHTWAVFPWDRTK